MAVVFTVLQVTHADYTKHTNLYLKPSQPIARRQHVARDTASCCPRETFEKRKSLIILSLAEPRYSAEAIWKTSSLFIYAHIRYVTNL
jgi:hypothetical protein